MSSRTNALSTPGANGKYKPLAIVGFGETAYDAPYNHDEVEIWTVNEVYIGDKVKRWDRLYQIHHDWDFSRDTNWNDYNHLDWLRNVEAPCLACEGTGKHCKCDEGVYRPSDFKRNDFPFQIVMQEVHDDIPGSVAYPLEEILDEFGGEDNREDVDYFTSSIALMIAQGIYEGFNPIGVYGIEMAKGTEYNFQKSSAEFWLGVARGRGVRLILPPGCHLLGKKVRRYGYEQKPRVNRMHLELHYRGHMDAMAELEALANQFQGKANALKFQLERTVLPWKRKKIIEQLQYTALDQQNMRLNVALHAGAARAIADITNEFDAVANPNDRAVTYGEIPPDFLEEEVDGERVQESSGLRQVDRAAEHS